METGSGEQRIVLVEDDVGLAGLIRDRLQAEGFRVRLETDGKAASQVIPREQPDLVILDIMLPGLDGFQVCRRVRPAYRGPILILTARDDDLDEVLGLELGADDYVTKPVRPRVLLARVRALLRRAHPPPEEPARPRRIEVGDLAVDASRREVSLGGRSVGLTTVEFDLLWYLAERAGEVVSRQDLYRAIYNLDYDGLDRSIDVYVSRLRHKLGDDPAAPRLIKTVRSVGYLLAGGGR
ncbi:MAG: response regulator transcription factor [Candidatus Latescibacterota bacterium]